MFVPLKENWQAVRLANRQALWDGKTAEPFVITGAEDFYLDQSLEETLLSERLLRQTADLAKADCTSDSENGVSCMLLRSAQSGCGLLLHRDENGWRCADFPIRTFQQIQQEKACGHQLLQMAQRALAFDREVEVPRSKWKLSKLLETIGMMLNDP